MSECGWKHEHYIDVLSAYRSAGYEIVRLIDYAKMDKLPEKVMILRHDVDISFRGAAEMSYLESANGFASSYYMRVHARKYNLLDTCNIYKLWDMEDQGHEIGLHIGAGESEILKEALGRSVQRQFDILSLVVNGSVSSASIHSRSEPGAADAVANWCKDKGLEFAYDDRFFKDIKYISDSRGMWREGCFCQWINRVPRLQVLTHPVWWHHKVPEENY